MYDGASLLEIIGRILMAGFFLVTIALNANKTQLKSHVDRMVAGHMPYPAFVFWFGIAMELVGAVLVLANWHARIGALLLIVFTVLATASLIPFELWELIVRPPDRKLAVLVTVLLNGAVVWYLARLLRRTSSHRHAT